MTQTENVPNLNLYDVGCDDCTCVTKGSPCLDSHGNPQTFWHSSRLDAARLHYRYGHQKGVYCNCGLGHTGPGEDVAVDPGCEFTRCVRAAVVRAGVTEGRVRPLCLNHACLELFSVAKGMGLEAVALQLAAVLPDA